MPIQPLTSHDANRVVLNPGHYWAWPVVTTSLCQARAIQAGRGRMF